MKLRKSAPRASNFPTMQRIIRPFRPPLSHQGKYIIRFEELRTAYVPSAKEDDDDDEGGDLANYRHF